MSSPGTDAVSVVTRFMTALSTVDAEGMLAEAADDVVIRQPAAPPGVPKEVAGKAAFAEMLGGMSLMWQSFSLTRLAVHPLGDDPDRAVAEYASDAVNSDGSPYRNTYLSIATVRDGQVVEFQEFYDTAVVEASVAALQATMSAQS